VINPGGPAHYSLELPSSWRSGDTRSRHGVMTYFPDLCCMTMIEAGSQIRAIGWLSSDHDYPKARPAPEFIRRLQHLCDTWHASQAVFGFHILLGYHVCEFCGTCRTSGNIRVPGDKVL